MARLLSAFCAGLMSLFLLPAQADSQDPSDVLGSWSFQTKPYRQGQCIMTGTMRLSSHPEEGLYGCELTAVEVCSMWGRSVVLQQCQARRFGNQVSIRSEITQMLEQKLVRWRGWRKTEARRFASGDAVFRTAEFDRRGRG